MSDVTLDQLQEAIKHVVAEINKANAAQQLLTLQTGEVLLAGIQHVGSEQLVILGLLLGKGIITAAELSAKREEIAAQWEVESALDPKLAALAAVASKLHQEIEQLKATLKERGT
jgi:hypothetical protein